MASLIDVGTVAKPGEDFASTGAHLDVRVLKDGKYINPETIRSLLTRLKVGKERTPLWQQQGETWKSAAPITSGFGPRTAPTAGASTYHPANDYGLSAGTSLAWEGPGSFTPGKGYGTIQTTDAQGNPYEIKLLHTKGGKASQVDGQLPAQQQQQTLPAGNTYNIYVGNKQNKEEDSMDFLSRYLGNLGSIKSSINPTEMLAQAFSQTPNYLS